MHALVMQFINQYTKFEMPRFANYKDVIGAKLKKRVICHCGLGFDTIYLRAQFDDASFSRS